MKWLLNYLLINSYPKIQEYGQANNKAFNIFCHFYIPLFYHKEIKIILFIDQRHNFLARPLSINLYLNRRFANLGYRCSGQQGKCWCNNVIRLSKLCCCRMERFISRDKNRSVVLNKITYNVINDNIFIPCNYSGTINGSWYN